MRLIFFFSIYLLCVVNGLIVNDVINFPTTNLGKKEIKFYREFLFVSGDGEFVDVVMYNGTYWNYAYRIEPHVNYTVTNFGLDLDVNDDILVIAADGEEGAIAFQYVRNADQWQFETKVQVSAEYNLVIYPPDQKDVISLRSSNEMIAFTIDGQFNAAFLKIFKKNHDTSEWEIQNIFSPQIKYSAQNRHVSLCWTNGYLFLTFLKGLDKTEIYTIDSNYEETLYNTFVDYNVNTDVTRFMDCMDDIFAVGLPAFQNEIHFPNNDTGKVRIYNVDEHLFDVLPRLENQFDHCRFGSGVSLDSNNIVVGSVSAGVNQIRSVDVFDRTGVFKYRLSNEDHVSVFSDEPTILDVSDNMIAANVNFFTGVVGNITIVHENGQTLSPTMFPTSRPTTLFPTKTPTSEPTTASPTETPTTLSPTMRPTVRPTLQPTTKRPTFAPTTEFAKPQKHYSIWIVFVITCLVVGIVDFLIVKILQWTNHVPEVVPSDVKNIHIENDEHEHEHDYNEDDVFLKRSIYK